MSVPFAIIAIFMTAFAICIHSLFVWRKIHNRRMDGVDGYVNSVIDSLININATLQIHAKEISLIAKSEARASQFNTVPPEDIEQIEGRFDTQDKLIAILEDKIARLETSPAAEKIVVERAMKIRAAIKSQQVSSGKLMRIRIEDLERKVEKIRQS